MLERAPIFIMTLVLWAGLTYAGEASGLNSFFNQETSRHIEAYIRDQSPHRSDPLDVSQFLSHEELSKLYRPGDLTPLWFDAWRLKPDAWVLLDFLRNAGAHGLCGNEYLLAQLEGLISLQARFENNNLPLAADSRALLDLYLSQAFLTFASHMIEGQVDPNLAHVDWRARRRKADLVKLLTYALDSGRIAQTLEGLFPPHREYRWLVEALADYQRISASGGWPVIPVGPSIEPGDRDLRVPRLQQVLLTMGDLEGPAEQEDRYDRATVAAVKKFQARHGLVNDGVVGRKTLAELNVPVEERIRQIELNLERWRWMPKDFGKRHLRVNVADFSLVVMEEGTTALKMPVIVGTQYRKTPVLSAQMTYLEFAPYWTVPPTILREDKLPLIKRDPGYLAEHHLRIVSRSGDGSVIDPDEINWQEVDADSFPGLLRMDPGPWNPLGRVKFMFPNRYDVYLHDTNETSLFHNPVRPFSSGCIRVERPQDLASYLLQGDLGKTRIEALLSATVPEKVPIEPFPVHIQYWTAWVEPDGTVHFRPDVYFRDADLEVALNEPAYRVMEQLQRNSEGSRAGFSERLAGRR